MFLPVQSLFFMEISFLFIMNPSDLELSVWEHEYETTIKADYKLDISSDQGAGIEAVR